MHLWCGWTRSGQQPEQAALLRRCSSGGHGRSQGAMTISRQPCRGVGEIEWNKNTIEPQTRVNWASEGDARLNRDARLPGKKHTVLNENRNLAPEAVPLTQA